MVGDAQIGKTSLMVKYVEGSWDEDYIQTLGTAAEDTVDIIRGRGAELLRCQFHGENDIDPQHGNHLLNLGFRGST